MTRSASLIFLTLSFIATWVGVSAQTVPSQAEGWKRIEIADGLFSTEVPAKPTITTEDLSTSGFKMSATYYEATDANIFTITGDLKLSTSIQSFSKAARMQLYTSYTDGVIQGIEIELEKAGFKADVKMGEIAEVTVANLAGYDQSIQIGNIRGRNRLLLEKTHAIMQLALVFPGGDAKAADRFWTSLSYSPK